MSDLDDNDLQQEHVETSEAPPSGFEPSYKAPGLEAFLSQMMGKSRVDVIRGGKCMTCDNPDIEFRDELSQREYTISGMCQRCQDSVFVEPEDDEDPGEGPF